MKVMTIVGTRPEIIKLSRVISELDKYVDHILVHTGQNYDYELNEIFFNDLGIRKPNYFLEAVGINASHTISKVISKIVVCQQYRLNVEKFQFFIWRQAIVVLTYGFLKK
jgi:UDP-N-acetylglucosamine 2-epimerase